MSIFTMTDPRIPALNLRQMLNREPLTQGLAGYADPLGALLGSGNVSDEGGVLTAAIAPMRVSISNSGEPQTIRPRMQPQSPIQVPQQNAQDIQMLLQSLFGGQGQ